MGSEVNLNCKFKIEKLYWKMQKENKFHQEFKKRLYKFVLKLISFIDSLNKKDRACFIISDQLLRSGTSILSNYIEAQAASSKREFTNYLTISLKSSNESKVWFALLRDANKASKDECNWFLQELTEISNILGSSVLTLKGKRS